MEYNSLKFSLSRCEMVKFQQPMHISAVLEERFSNFSQKNIALTKTLRMFKGTKKESRKGNPGTSLGLGGYGLWPIGS